MKSTAKQLLRKIIKEEVENQTTGGKKYKFILVKLNRPGYEMLNSLSELNKFSWAKEDLRQGDAALWAVRDGSLVQINSNGTIFGSRRKPDGPL